MLRETSVLSLRLAERVRRDRTPAASIMKGEGMGGGGGEDGYPVSVVFIKI